MTFSAFDHAMMRRALELAAKGMYSTAPNPRVGCVVTRGERVIGEGWHETAGGPHAEVVALRNVAAEGATLYVNLEPCNHHGRTPPCVDLLLGAKVARVVAAMRDPNSQAAGGAERLAAAGVRFEHGLLEDEARELNIGFISRVTRGRPWVRLKVAATLDGRTALPDGRSQWITGPEARRDGHRWRARASAILTGIGTVRADNPQLTVRDVDTPRQPPGDAARSAQLAGPGVHGPPGQPRRCRSGAATQCGRQGRPAAHAGGPGTARRERAAGRSRLPAERLAGARGLRR